MRWAGRSYFNGERTGGPFQLVCPFQALLEAPRSGFVQHLRSAEGRLGKAGDRAQVADVNFMERITIDSEQCGGKPCIRHMRIRVKDVLEMLGSGMSESEILAEFPYLEADDLRAAQLYAARLTDHAVLRSV